MIIIKRGLDYVQPSFIVIAQGVPHLRALVHWRATPQSPGSGRATPQSPGSLTPKYDIIPL